MYVFVYISIQMNSGEGSRELFTPDHPGQRNLFTIIWLLLFFWEDILSISEKSQ